MQKKTIQQITGIAVSITPTSWSYVIDAIQLSDAPSSGLIPLGLFVFDGTNWVRVRGNITDGILTKATNLLSDSKTALLENQIVIEDYTVTSDKPIMIASGSEATFRTFTIESGATARVKGALTVESLTIEDGGELIVYDGAEIEIYGT